MTGRARGETGLFVVFEGGDAVGKSTQVELLVAPVSEHSATGRGTFEPGDTPTAGARSGSSCSIPPPGTCRRAPRRCCTRPTRRSTWTRWSARPWPRGAVVVCDRYVDSMLAYQGAGRVLEPAELELGRPLGHRGPPARSDGAAGPRSRPGRGGQGGQGPAGGGRRRLPSAGPGVLPRPGRARTRSTTWCSTAAAPATISPSGDRGAGRAIYWLTANCRRRLARWAHDEHAP